MGDDILQMSGICKHFGGVRASDDIYLSVKRNEFHAIIGPNGAGKTTLIAQLSGGIKPDSGTVKFNSRDITNMPMHKRCHLGLARSFQITSLIMSMSVLENVALAVQAQDGHSFRFWKPAAKISKLREPAMAVLQELGLACFADQRVSSLSHGERRQIEIAVALASEPEMLLLDEPMAGMGAAESAAMVDTLKGLKGKKSVLLVEHDMDAVFALADRVSVLVYGRVIATDRPEIIRENEQVRQAYLGES